jgi:hypothetical protein
MPVHRTGDPVPFLSEWTQGWRAHLGPVACAWVNHDQDMRDAHELGVALDARFAPVGDVHVVDEPAFRSR